MSQTTVIQQTQSVKIHLGAPLAPGSVVSSDFIDGGNAFSMFSDFIDGGSASSTPSDFIDGGSA